MFILVEKYTYVGGELANWGEYEIYEEIPVIKHIKFDIIAIFSERDAAEKRKKEKECGL